jgi:hypothetical protein
MDHKYYITKWLSLSNWLYHYHLFDIVDMHVKNQTQNNKNNLKVQKYKEIVLHPAPAKP